MIGYSAIYTLTSQATLPSALGYTNIGPSTGITLVPGVWLLEGNCIFTIITTVSNLQYSLGFSTSSTSFTYGTTINNFRYKTVCDTNSISNTSTLIPIDNFTQTVTLTSQTTIYFLIRATYSSGNVAVTTSTNIITTRIA